MPSSYMSLHGLQSLSNQLKIGFRSRDPVHGLLLKAVQNVNSIGESHCVHSPVRAAETILDKLKNSCRAKPLQRLCLLAFLSDLSQVKRIAENVLNFLRHGLEIFPRGSYPE